MSHRSYDTFFSFSLWSVLWAFPLLGVAAVAAVPTPENGGALTNSDEYMLTSEEIIIGILCTVSGAIICFLGYRLYKPLICFTGFFFGYWLCFIIMTNIDVDYGENESWIIFAGCLATGLIGGLIMLLILPIGIFFLGALAGFFFGMWILSFVPETSPLHEDLYRALFIGGFALVFSFCTIVFDKPIIIFASALVGAYLLFYGIDMFAQTGFAETIHNILRGEPVSELNDPLLIMLISSILTTILGIVSQSLLTKDINYKKEQETKVYVKIN